MASGTPDLQAILATLAQSTARQTSTEPNTPEPRHVLSLDNNLQAAEQPMRRPDDARLRPQSRNAAASPRPMIDPATITVWQEGLRCITKIAAQSDQISASIKRMMKDQRANEMRWYRERQDLKHVQSARTASAAKARSILKSLNTSFYQTPPEVDSPERVRDKELAEFDRKVYSAQVAMETAMTAELKSLGVPFFGTDQSLVVPDDYDTSMEQVPETHPKWSPLITESGLLELRRRMVSHLEDLYRD